MRKLKVRPSLLWLLFIAALIAVVFTSVESAWAQESKAVVTPVDGFYVDDEGVLPMDGSAVAGIDMMCSLQAYSKGDPIAMRSDNTVFLPPHVCQEIAGYLLMLVYTGELAEQKSF